MLSILCAVGTWTYADRVLVPHQKSDAIAYRRPRGNLSDLYPRWLGARELLLHGRDPYSADVTREIQIGFYGRPLDPSRPEDPSDEEGFAYPVYVIFLSRSNDWLAIRDCAERFLLGNVASDLHRYPALASNVAPFCPALDSSQSYCVGPG